MRLWLAAVPALLLFLPACGGDDGKPATPVGGASGAPTNTPEPVLPTPTPVPLTGIALTIASGGKTFTPTVGELTLLPKTEITAGGQKRSGPTLKALLDSVSAGASGTVTIEGTRPDGKRSALIRYPLADVAENTVLVLDGQGHVSLYSTKIPEAEWLSAIVSVVIN